MRGAWTAWDARAAARAAAIALAAFFVAWLVTAATDEGGVAWGVRAGRALPLAPACAAIGTWLSLAPGRARGEDRALAALGRSPLERAFAAVAGGAAIALVAAFAIAAVPRVDVDGFYPRVARSVTYRYEGAAFVSDDGWRVARDGAPLHAASANDASAPARAIAALPPHARGAASLATALAGIALPLLVAQLRRRTLGATLLAVAITTAATIVLFQAAATAKVGVFVASLPPFMLLAAALASYGSWRWQTAKSRR
jgi:hypothetical protein